MTPGPARTACGGCRDVVLAVHHADVARRRAWRRATTGRVLALAALARAETHLAEAQARLTAHRAVCDQQHPKGTAA